MDFLYDETGSAYSFIYNGTQYYYVKNLQGDAIESGWKVGDDITKLTKSGNAYRNLLPVTPAEYAAIDPFRHLK